VRQQQWGVTRSSWLLEGGSRGGGDTARPPWLRGRVYSRIMRVVPVNARFGYYGWAIRSPLRFWGVSKPGCTIAAAPRGVCAITDLFADLTRVRCPVQWTGRNRPWALSFMGLSDGD